MFTLIHLLAFGFLSLLIHSTNAVETVYTYDLCREEPIYQFIDVTGDFLMFLNDRVTYRLDSTSCNRNIMAAYYYKVDGYNLEVFEGWGTTGTAIDIEKSVGTSNFSHAPGKITARITLIGKTNSTLHLLFTSIATGARILGATNRNDNNVYKVEAYNQTTIIAYMAFPSYMQEYGMGFEFTGDLKFEMYQGLNLAETNLIYSESLKATGCNARSVQPRFVYGNYVIFKLLNTTGAGTIQYYARRNEMLRYINMTDSRPLGTPPCPPVSSAELHEWSYELTYGGSGKRRTVGIDLLAPIRADASLQIMEYNGDDLVADKTYNSTSNFCGFKTNATRAIMNYYYLCKPDTNLQQQRELLFQYGPGDEIPGDSKKASRFSIMVLCLAIIYKWII